MHSIQQFARFVLSCCDDDDHPVVKEHRLCHEHLPGRVSHLRFRGGWTVLFLLRVLPRNLLFLVAPHFWWAGLPLLVAGKPVVRHRELWELRYFDPVQRLSCSGTRHSWRISWMDILAPTVDFVEWVHSFRSLLSARPPGWVAILDRKTSEVQNDSWPLVTYQNNYAPVVVEEQIEMLPEVVQTHKQTHRNGVMRTLSCGKTRIDTSRNILGD